MRLINNLQVRLCLAILALLLSPQLERHQWGEYIAQAQAMAAQPSNSKTTLAETQAVSQPVGPTASESLLSVAPDPEFSMSSAIKDSIIPSHAILIARQQARLSTQFSGEVERVLVHPSASFTKGQLLVQFKCQQQIADYHKAKADMHSAAVAWRSAKQLDQLESISKLDVAQSEASYKKSKADAVLKKDIVSHCQLTAPYDGEVSELLVKPYEVVKAGDVLMEIVNNNSLFVEVYVPSSWLKWIKSGTQFKIKLNEYPENVSATVVKVGAKVDTNSQTIQLYGKLNKNYTHLVNGMSGIAYFKGHTS